MRISDWSSDVCSSDLASGVLLHRHAAHGHSGHRRHGMRHARHRSHVMARSHAGHATVIHAAHAHVAHGQDRSRVHCRYWGPQPFADRERAADVAGAAHVLGEDREGVLATRFDDDVRSEEHTSELQSLMRISYDVFGVKTKSKATTHKYANNSTL